MGIYDFNAWDIPQRSFWNPKSSGIKRQICNTLDYIQKSFHSSVNAVTVLKRYHDKFLVKSKQARANGCMASQFDNSFSSDVVTACMGTKGRMLIGVKKLVMLHIHWHLWNITLTIYRNLTENLGWSILLSNAYSALVKVKQGNSGVLL